MELTLGIFFDGTGNSINDKPQTITNIAKLYKVYGESDKPLVRKLYVRGVGSKKHKDDSDRPGGNDTLSRGIDRMFGGAFCAGGHDRIDFRIPKQSVKYVYHLVAEDELRKNFDWQSIRPDSSVISDHDDSACTGNRWMVEIVCPGVYSDIGGGTTSFDLKIKSLSTVIATTACPGIIWSKCIAVRRSAACRLGMHQRGSSNSTGAMVSR